MTAINYFRSQFVIIIPDLRADNILSLSMIITSHEEQAYCYSKSMWELLYSNPTHMSIEGTGIKFVGTKLKFPSYGFAYKILPITTN